MPYEKTQWIDHVVDPETEEVIQQGTRFAAQRMNKIENGIYNITEEVIAHKKENTYFENVANMKAATGLAANMVVITNGYYTRGDGGGGKYLIVDDGTLTDDGGSYHQISTSSLFAKLIYDREVNVRQFGAKGDGVTDDRTAIVNAIAAAKSVFFDGGFTFTVSADITISRYVRLFSDGTAIIKNTGSGYLFEVNYRYKTSTSPQIDNITLMGDGSNYGIKVSMGNAWGASLYLSRFQMIDFTKNFLFESVFNVKVEYGYVYTKGLAGSGVVEFGIAAGLHETNGFSNACEFNHVYISPSDTINDEIPIIFKCKAVKNIAFRNCSFQHAEYCFDFSGGGNDDFDFASNWFEKITYFQDVAKFYPRSNNRFVYVDNLYNGQNSSWDINRPDFIKYKTDSTTGLIQKLMESGINYPYAIYYLRDNNDSNFNRIYEFSTKGLFVYHNFNTWLNTVDGADSISINFLTLNQYANLIWKWEVFTQIIIDTDGSQFYDKRIIYTNTQTSHCDKFDAEQKYTGGAAATAVVTASMVNNTLTIACDKTVRNIIQRITGTPMGKWEKSFY